MTVPIKTFFCQFSKLRLGVSALPTYALIHQFPKKGCKFWNYVEMFGNWLVIATHLLIQAIGDYIYCHNRFFNPHIENFPNMKAWKRSWYFFVICFFTTIFGVLNLKAHSNNDMFHSDRTLITQIYFLKLQTRWYFL